MKAQSSTRLHSERTVRVAIYCRKSHEDRYESDYTSIDAQRDMALEYLAQFEQLGWVLLVQQYEDMGFSGGTLKRPALQRLIRDVKLGNIDIIVIYRWDRLSRSSRDYDRLEDDFRELGVEIHCVNQPIDTSTPMGRFTKSVIMNIAQLERETAAERIRDKVAAAKKSGRYTGGPAVLGYDVDHLRKALVVNDEEAVLVRRIFTDFIRDGSATRLAQQLNAEGKTTKQYLTVKGILHEGRPWNKMHIYRLLQNPLYLGKVVHRGEWYTGRHDAIISQELWDSAHAILATNAHVRANRARAKTPALLKGLIRCGHCQRAMGVTFTRKPNRAYRYYLCAQAAKAGYQTCPVRAVPAGMLEDAVVGQLRAIFQSPELAATTYRSARARVHGESNALPTGFSERELVETLSAIDPIWEHLFLPEQARIVQLLVEQVIVHEDQLDIVMRVDGLHSLITELQHIATEAVHDKSTARLEN